MPRGDADSFGELARVVALWGRLNPTMHAAIVALVEAGAGEDVGEKAEG